MLRVLHPTASYNRDGLYGTERFRFGQTDEFEGMPLLWCANFKPRLFSVHTNAHALPL